MCDVGIDNLSSQAGKLPVPREQDQTAESASRAGTYGMGYQTTAPISLRERLFKDAGDNRDRARELHNFAARLTPEVEELINVIKEGIRLGVLSFDGRLTRY